MPRDARKFLSFAESLSQIDNRRSNLGFRTENPVQQCPHGLDDYADTSQEPQCCGFEKIETLAFLLARVGANVLTAEQEGFAPLALPGYSNPAPLPKGDWMRNSCFTHEVTGRNNHQEKLETAKNSKQVQQQRREQHD